MKEFIVKIFIFLIPIIVGLSFIEYKLINNDDSYYYKKKCALDKSLNKSEILIFGSSAENSGINPKLFLQKRGVNLAFIGGTTVDVFSKLLNRYIDEMPKLNTVIIPISSFTFFATEERDEMKFRKILLNHYFDIYNDEFNKLLPKSMMYYLGFKKSAKTLFSKKLYNINEYGFETIIGSNSDLLTNEYGINTVYRHIGEQLNDKLCGSIYYRNINILNDMITELQRRNIRVLIVTLPTHKSYYSNIKTETKLLIKNTINSIIIKYNMQYYDYTIDNRFVDTDFYNCDHLNIDGANKFSKILYEELLLEKQNRQSE